MKKRNKNIHDNKSVKECDYWDSPPSDPDIHIVRDMWAECVSCGVKLIMKNHIYKFEHNSIRRNSV